jgi:NodT family efflux transporter outer membrane factor (OMF) lipoprotein
MNLFPFRLRAAAFVVAATAAVLLGGCAAGPDYARPEMTLPANFKEAPGWQPARPADDAPRGPWWTVFGDAELDALQARLEASNPSLRAALARHEQASALTGQARAGFFPSVGATAGASRSRNAAAGTATAVSALASASWEPDLWGRVRRSVEAAAASAEASRADMETTRLALHAQLAQNYFALRVVDAQSRMLDETVGAYERSADLARNRFKAGLVTRADVSSAEAQLASAQASRADADVARAQLEHAIAVLTGRAPADFSLAARAALPTVQTLPRIPALLPAQLLQRRPDVAAAERRAAAANAQIGVARSAYFPALSIAAGGGFSGTTFSDLFSLPHRVWSIGPALAASLFDGGARAAGVEAARAGFDAAAADYRQTVLAALQDTEDALAALRLLEQEAAFQNEAVRAARDALQSATNQYKAGTAGYATVIVAQTALLTAQRAQLDLHGRRLNANVALIRALGGGWQADAPR